jgi:dienelactone hydrolase
MTKRWKRLLDVKCGLSLALLIALSPGGATHAEESAPAANEVAGRAPRDGTVFLNPADRPRLAAMWGAEVRKRRIAANERENEAWRRVRSRSDWEHFRDVRIEALHRSLGESQEPPADLKVKVTGTLRGAGYTIENLVFESRPGLRVTANLYAPSEPPPAMPGIVICHSHHNPKWQSELQEMGVLWARQGCLVLVMDQLGHGERRQHPFRSKEDYAGEFRPGRQDYYFRSNVGMQLHLIGESLIGWMTWDLSRGVDLLLSRPGIDRTRIILVGAVAGGGDPAAVTAALDPRIAAVVPFNFGGPQPETAFPLPPDSQTSFDYFGDGSWESTRNLRWSARDGFAPWVIVGSVAPRRLVYAHEFAWDQEHDPVWRRLKSIYAFYEPLKANASDGSESAPSNLASTHGAGSVRGRGPGNTHCNNIGPVHLVAIHAAFERWFHIPIPRREDLPRHTAEELTCLTPAATSDRPMVPVHQLAQAIGARRAAAARERLAKSSPAERRQALRRDWARLLGDPEPRQEPRVLTVVDPSREDQFPSDRRPPLARQGPKPSGASPERSALVASVDRLALEVEPGIVVPLVLLTPRRPSTGRRPVVVAVAQAGKQAFLDRRAGAIADILAAGIAVCLPDLRGTGETKPDDGRGRDSSATSLSSAELMLGQTAVGARVRDLRSILRYLRTRPELDGRRVALWGESFAASHRRDQDLAVPLELADSLPHAEPLGGLVVLLTALFEDEIQAVSARGGLAEFQSLLESPFILVPHDVIIPGAIAVGDLGDVAAALAPRPLQLAELVDGRNRPLTAEEAAAALARVKSAYGAAAAARWSLPGSGADSAAKWLVDALRD